MLAVCSLPLIHQSTGRDKPEGGGEGEATQQEKWESLLTCPVRHASWPEGAKVDQGPQSRAFSGDVSRGGRGVLRSWGSGVGEDGEEGEGV